MCEDGTLFACLPATALYEAVSGIRTKANTPMGQQCVNFLQHLAIARLDLQRQRQPADAIPTWGPKLSTQSFDHFASHP